MSVTILLQQVAEPDPFFNSVPRFLSFVVDDDQVHPTNAVALQVTHDDPDPDDVVTIEWTADGGSFDDAASATPIWTAPEAEGLYHLVVTATDLADATASLTRGIDVRIYHGHGDAAVNLELNTWPVAEGLVPTPNRIDVGESTALDLTASDPDGDALSFAWSADCTGTFDDGESEDPVFTLTADNGGHDCTLSVAITDGRGGETTAEIILATGPGLCDDGSCEPPLAELPVFEDFERADEAPLAAPWVVQDGTWTLTDGAAVASGGHEDPCANLQIGHATSFVMQLDFEVAGNDVTRAGFKLNVASTGTAAGSDNNALGADVGFSASPYLNTYCDGTHQNVPLSVLTPTPGVPYSLLLSYDGATGELAAELFETAAGPGSGDSVTRPGCGAGPVESDVLSLFFATGIGDSNAVTYYQVLGSIEE